MTNFSSHDEKPDLSKPLSRFNAGYWAIMSGIAALLDASEWKLLDVIYTHLPNVRPGQDRLAAMAGISGSSVVRGRKRLREAGLINYAENLKGGSGEVAVTQYTVADIRDSKVAAVVIAKLTAMNAEPQKKRKRAAVYPCHHDTPEIWGVRLYTPNLWGVPLSW